LPSRLLQSLHFTATFAAGQGSVRSGSPVGRLSAVNVNGLTAVSGKISDPWGAAGSLAKGRTVQPAGLFILRRTPDSQLAIVEGRDSLALAVGHRNVQAIQNRKPWGTFYRSVTYT